MTSPLSQAVDPYTKSRLAGVPGAERALQCFLGLLRKWIAVERWFCDGKTYADAVDSLRKAHKEDYPAVLEVCRAHEQLAASTEIVIRMISSISDGTRVDFKSSATSAIGKRVSLVAGAESLHLAMSVVSEIGSMGSSDEYSEAALRARKLLLQESIPNREQRKQEALNAAKIIASSQGTSRLPREAESLIEDHIPMNDILFPLLHDVVGTEEEGGMLELYLRNLYRTYTLKDFHRDGSQRLVKFSFFNQPAEGAINAASSVNSMNDLTRMVSSGSLSKLSEGSERSQSESSVSHHQSIPKSVLRTGVCVVVDKLSELSDEAKFSALLRCFPQFTGQGQKYDASPANVLYIIVLHSDNIQTEASDDDAFASELSSFFSEKKPLLDKADIRRVSCIFNQEHEGDFQDFVPALFTLYSPEFKEDSLYRRIDPSLSTHLYLERIGANFHIRSLGSRHTPNCQVHLYESVPRKSALAKDQKANKSPRLFARALSLLLDFSSSGFERILVDALNAMDLCTLKSKSDNHLFLNLVTDFEGTVIDPVVVEQIVVEILKRHSDRVLTLGIVEVETRIVCSLSSDSPPIAIRLFASNPTGYVHVMNTYVEAVNESGTERVYKLISGTKASLASAGDSSWDGLRIQTPYPLTRPFDAQRKAALKSSDTIYCYDLPALFEAAVERQWLDHSKQGGVSGLANPSGRPLMVMYTTELVVQHKDGSGAEKWTMKDFLEGGLHLVSVDRRAGLNDVGMVAWLVTLKTVEYPNVSIFCYRIICAHTGVAIGSSSCFDRQRYYPQGRKFRNKRRCCLQACFRIRKTEANPSSLHCGKLRSQNWTCRSRQV